MLYILWGLLNIGLFIFFIITCFRATKLVKEKFGVLAAVVLVFGLLSFISNSNKDDNDHQSNSNQIRTWEFNSRDSVDINSTRFMQIALEKTLVSKYELGIKYGKQKEGQINIPLSANSWTTGFMSGTNWKATSIIVNKTNENNRFEYHVTSTVEWKLLGITIYSQPKVYRGYALIK
jgi:hypothetical protein